LQLIVGIIMIPLGGLISFGAMSGDSIYPYWIVGGIVFAIFGIVFIIRGATSLLRPKPALQQASMSQHPYAGQGQYAQQPPYSQPQPQPYAQPQYPIQPAPSEQVYYPRQTYEQ
jgi:hypothetical protein